MSECDFAVLTGEEEEADEEEDEGIVTFPLRTNED